MSEYDVYLKDNKIKLVKRGFSWSALFFTYLWFFYHDMFLHGFIWIVVYLSLYSLCVLFINHLSIIDRNCICIILWFGLGLLPAFYGNELLKDELFMEEWRYKHTVEARNIKEARRIANEFRKEIRK